MNYRLLILFTQIVLLGCAAKGPVPNLPKPNVFPVLPGYDEEIPPIQAEVVAEEYDGRTLHVQVKLTTRKEILANAVRVSLSGKKGGETLKSVSAIPKLEDKEAILSPNTFQLVSLKLDSPGITDYSVDVEWGSSKKLQNTVEIPPSLILGQAANIESKCKEDICSTRYLVAAKVENRSERVLKDITVGTSFTVRGSDESGLEEKLQIPELNIPPGGSQEFEISLDQEVPRQILRKLEPKVRLINFSYG